MDEFEKQMHDIFVFETNTFLQQLETILMEAEGKDGNILEAVPEIFRIMHTIKSSSAMMELPNISKLAHSMEDLFYYIRENKPTNIDKQKLTTIIFSGVDYIKNGMSTKASEDPSAAILQINAYLEELRKGASADASPQSASIACRITFKPNCAMISLRAFEIITKVERIEKPTLIVPPEETPDGDAILQEKGLLLCFASDEHQEALLAKIKASPFVETAVFTQGATLLTDASPAASAPSIVLPEPTSSGAPVAHTPPPAAPAASSEGVRTRADGTPFVDRRSGPRNDGNYIAIEIKKLDQLVDLAGELLIASMGASHALNAGESDQLHIALDSLHRLIVETQDHALSLRMISVKDIFHKLNRSVRDATTKLDKQIDFSMSGEDTAIDRNVIDHIFSPLMHILRNAVDHGIEETSKRLAAGKPPQGKIHLSAAMEGNHAVISVTDDGQGIDRDATLKKAIAKDLITEEQAQKMSDEDVFGLLFLPGFSMKSEITELSGRGVGLDVVSDSLRKMNGRVTISSILGQGTKMELRIPLTLAILDALILQVGEETCALPISAVKEVFYPSPDSIRQVNGEDVTLLRGSCYQIVRLGDVFGLPHTDYEDGLMLLLDANGEPYALYISRALEQKSIVVKPIPPLLKGIPGIFGCTILGGGQVCLIIDAVGLWERAKERGGERAP